MSVDLEQMKKLCACVPFVDASVGAGVAETMQAMTEMIAELTRLRTVLELTDIRVERVQDISEDDAKAEGVEASNDMDGRPCWRGTDTSEWHWSARNAFRDLWNSINGPGSWAASPWVWALTFKKVEVSK